MDVHYPVISCFLIDLYYRCEQSNHVDFLERIEQAKLAMGFILSQPDGDANTDSGTGMVEASERPPYSPRRQICGVDLFNFIVYVCARAESTVGEVAAYILSNGGEVYSDEVIMKQLKEFQKAEMNTMFPQANVWSNQNPHEGYTQRRAWTFWNVEIRGIPRRKLIDVVDFGITLEKCRRSNKLVPKLHRVGKYGRCYRDNGDRIGLCVILAIEAGDPSLRPNVSGTIESSRRWIRCLRENRGVINGEQFAEFCEDVCVDIEQHDRDDQEGIENANMDNRGADNTDDRRRFFMWENSDTHDAGWAYNAVSASEQRSLPFGVKQRPMGHPHFSPAEYKMCEIAERLRLVEELYDWNLVTLVEVIHGICYHRLGNFNSVFEHCGYSE